MGMYFNHLEQGTIRYPLVLYVWFLLHIRKGLISRVQLSVVVHPKPQEVSLRNRIGDHTGDVPCLSLGSGGTMCLIFLTFSLFLPIFVQHLVVCSSIDTPLKWFDPWPTFYHFLLCIHMLLAKIRVHTPFWLRLLSWEVARWVVSVAGSSWVLMLSIDCFFHDQRPLFH